MIGTESANRAVRDNRGGEANRAVRDNRAMRGRLAHSGKCHTVWDSIVQRFFVITNEKSDFERIESKSVQSESISGKIESKSTLFESNSANIESKSILNKPQSGQNEKS